MGQGVDRQGLLAASGLTAEALAALDGWVPVARFRALWDVAVDRAPNDDFGLHAGRAFRLTSLALVGYLLLTAETLEDALRDLVRYGDLLGFGGVLSLEVGEGSACVELACPLPDAPVPVARHCTEAVFAAVVGGTETLTGRRLPVEAVALRHACPPTGAAAHAAVFGVAPTFGADRYAVSFEARALGWRVRSASPALHATFEDQANRAMARLSTRVRDRAAAAVESRFEGQIPALATVAADLAMSERTLQRYLDAEGTSFQTLCDEVRRSLALRLLRRDDRTIHDVAFQLGYSAPSAFHRAFKRWTGETPGDFRSRPLPSEGRPRVRGAEPGRESVPPAT